MAIKGIKELESGFQQTLKEYAKLRGWLYYHTYNSQRSDPGFPDTVLVRGDRLIFIELKTLKGRVSSAQQIWIDRLSKTYAEVWVFRPSDWKLIEEVLK